MMERLKESRWLYILVSVSDCGGLLAVYPECAEHRQRLYHL